MASAACSSTCITGGEFFVRRQALHKETLSPKHFGGFIAASYASFHGHICVARRKHLFSLKAIQRVPIFCEEKGLEPVRMNFQLPGKSNFKAWYLDKRHKHLIKAVATVEPYCLINSGSVFMDDSNFWFDSNPESQMAQCSVDYPQLEESEKLRRMRISKANKGNIPWNKGRKHSPETLQRIRERTKLAMQNPKVKRKLMNLGHAQSDETKKKIAAGVRQGWQRRRGVLMVQERCIFEWKNIIAEASRKGYAGEIELQWDSFKVIDEQLTQVWLESIEKRKSMPKSKGSKRAPKSLEQRRKISEAISAKWADPEYRNRVYAGLTKYHGTPIGSEKEPRKKTTAKTSREKSSSIKKKHEQTKPEQTAQSNIDLKNFKQITYRKRKKSAPSYNDPMSSAKLELLKKIKADRAELETRKKEATMRARLLIADAERAANALEVAALKSPLAKASLLETRKLIAEANLSLKSIEGGHLMSKENVAESYFHSNSDRSKKHLQTNMITAINQVNGFHNLSSSENGNEITQFEMTVGIEAVEGPEAALSHLPPYHPKRIESDRAENIAHNSSDLVSRNPNDSISGSKKTRKWVSGRLVETES